MFVDLNYIRVYFRAELVFGRTCLVHAKSVIIEKDLRKYEDGPEHVRIELENEYTEAIHSLKN